MNRTVKLLFCLALIVFGAASLAWQKASNSKHLVLPTVYLDHSDYKGGPINKEEFSRLLKQGLSARDSFGYKYKVMGFDFNYAERQLYEDSIGNLRVFTDFLLEYCPGDTITSNISASIYERIKPGDTVFIDRVQVARYLDKANKKIDSEIVSARPMKCVIVK